MKKRVISVVVAVLVAVGLVFAPSSPAAATDVGVDMNYACQLQYGAYWQSKVLDPGNAYSWRCWVPPYGVVMHGIDVNNYCYVMDLGYAVVLDPGNAYSWRCWS